MSLVFLTLVPLIAAGVLVAAPSRLAKSIALTGTLAAIAAFVPIAMRFDWSDGAAMQFVWSLTWVESLGLSLSVGVDSVAMLLIGLTVLLGPICVACSFTAIGERLKTYYGWLLVLQAAMTGVFCARDVVLFYVFFEFTLVPMYVLISLYGSTNRRAAATKFFLYTFTGSLVTLAGLVYLAWKHASLHGGAWSFAIADLAATASSMSFTEQAWVFWAMMAGFAVKVPIFPVHTWLPLAHTEAPTAGSVVLAGVLLKLGTYGIYRFALPFAPEAAWHFAPVLGVLAVIGIVYAGLICWVQTDVKKLVAYSSVSHLGFCVLGLFALNSVGLTGSVLYMVNHGLSTGALFLLIGMVYERYHTRSMKELGGLAAKMPVWSFFMVFFAMASVGLPGLNGFVSEFLCLLGAFQAYGPWTDAGGTGLFGNPGGTAGVLGPWFAGAAGLGLIVTAIYILYMVGSVVFGPLKLPGGHGDGHGDGDGHGGVLPVDLSAREIAVLAPLAVLCLGLGLYPRPLLVALEAPTQELAAFIEAANAGRMDGVAAVEGGSGVEVFVEGGGEVVLRLEGGR